MLKVGQALVLRIDRIRVPGKLQREFDLRHAQKIIDDFRPELLDSIHVNRLLNGQYEVFNGQHRLFAVKHLGLSTVNCLVWDNLTEKEKAEIFQGLEKGKKRICATDMFNSEIVSEEPDALAIEEICNRYGVPIGSDGEKHQNRGFYLRAVRVARLILRDFGYERLDQTMRIITGAWPGQSYAMYEPMVNGVSLFCEYFGKQENFDEAKAIKQLSKRTAEAIVHEGRERRRNRGAYPAIEIATTILKNLYNYRLLKDKQLRTSSELEELAFKSK